MEKPKKEEGKKAGIDKNKIFLIGGAILVSAILVFYLVTVYATARNNSFVAGANWGITASAQKLAQTCQPLEIELTDPTTQAKVKVHLILTECLQGTTTQKQG